MDTCSIDQVNARFKHSTLTAQHLLIAVFGCALAGCWEEIHYTPPPAGDAKSRRKPTSGQRLRRRRRQRLWPDDAQPEAIRRDRFSGRGAESSRHRRAPPPRSDEPTATAARRRPCPQPASDGLALGQQPEPRGARPTTARPPRKRSPTGSTSPQRLAKLLGTTVADLPPRPATADSGSARRTRRLTICSPRARSIGRDLATQHGDDHAALFELAVKSNILLVLYQTGGTGRRSHFPRQSARSDERAKLPAELCQPLLTLLDDGAPASDRARRRVPVACRRRRLS